MAPVADTFVQSGTEAGWDHGLADHLDVDQSPADVSYLKFDLPALGAPVARATLTLFCGALLAYTVAAPFLPRGGWGAPTFTGFSVARGALRVDAVRQLPLWKDTLIAYGLEWYALLTVASIALLLSVLFRSSAAAIGTMLASLIGGTILTRVSPDWTAGKYLFVSALPLADYYTGEPPPYDGMSMMFCLGLLAAWAIGATIVAYAIFTRRDVFG